MNLVSLLSIVKNDANTPPVIPPIPFEVVEIPNKFYDPDSVSFLAI